MIEAVAVVLLLLAALVILAFVEMIRTFRQTRRTLKRLQALPDEAMADLQELGRAVGDLNDTLFKLNQQNGPGGHQ